MIIQVITRQIGKDAPVEGQTTDTLLVDRMRTNLHKGILATGIHHPGHQVMEGDRVRRRMVGRNRLAIDIVADGREQPHFMPHLPEHLVQERRNRCLSVCSGHSHQYQVVRRILIPSGKRFT